MVVNQSVLAEQLGEISTPLTTTDPEADYTDLEPIGEALSNAHIIGLGEATHGTREFFQLKHRIIRYLVERRGMRLFGLEANFSETLTLNRYVRNGEDNPHEGLSKIYFWTWNTEEVLALIEWLREFNQDRPSDDRVSFFGFDAQFTAGPAAALDSYLKVTDTALHEELSPTLESLDDEGQLSDDPDVRKMRLEAAAEVTDSLGRELRESRDAHIAKTDRRTWDLAKQHLQTLQQAASRKRAQHEDDFEQAIALRDRAMAENVVWMLDYEDVNEAILWGHNAHLNRSENRASDGTFAPSMGYHLANHSGANYYALGFDFAGGCFQAVSKTDDGYELKCCSLREPAADSATKLFAAVDEKLLFVDMDTATADNQLADWFSEQRAMRAVGAIYYGEGEVERHHDQRILTESYDGILFVQETSRAVPLS